ncbi:MAG: DUF192 domain-containing protein [Candidatus Paceibacterota bacterium]
MKNKYINLSLVIVFFLIAFFLINNPSQNLNLENIKEVRIAGESIKVDLAITKEMHEKGLSGRSTLENDEGMLFVFDKPGKYYFWMKGMNFPIDIIWFDENMKVVYIKKDARKENFLETYGPNINTKYVLEVVSNFSDKNNLKIGDEILFTY